VTKGKNHENLEARDALLRGGMIVDATLIAA
jgi:hypothetical protein